MNFIFKLASGTCISTPIVNVVNYRDKYDGVKVYPLVFHVQKSPALLHHLNVRNAEQAFQLWRLIINLILPIRMISSYLRFNLSVYLASADHAGRLSTVPSEICRQYVNFYEQRSSASIQTFSSKINNMGNR